MKTATLYVLLLSGVTSVPKKECEEITEKSELKDLLRLLQILHLQVLLLQKILWVRNNEPENYAKCKHILLPKDYVRYILTGEFCY